MVGTVRLPNIETRLTGNSRGFTNAAKRAARATRDFQRRQFLLRRELNRSTAAARNYVRSVASIRGAVALLAGGGGLGLIVRNTARAGAELQNFADSAGFSVEALQALQRAGGDWNIEAQTIDQGLVRFTRVIGEANQGLATYTRIFDELGVSIRGTDGELRSTQDVFVDFVSALQNVGNSAQRNALLMQAFGRQGARLGLLFERVGAQGIEAFIDSQRSAGILTQEQVDSLQGLNREFNTLGDILTYHKRVVVSNVAEPWRDIVRLIGQQAPAAFSALETGLRTTVIPALEFTVRNFDGLAKAALALVLTFSSVGRLLAGGLAVAFAGLTAGGVAGAKGVFAGLTAGFKALVASMAGVFAMSRRITGYWKRMAMYGFKVTAWMKVQSRLWPVFGAASKSVNALGRGLQSLASRILPALIAAFKPLLLAAAKIIAVFTAISVAINLFTDFDNTIVNLKRFGKELLSIFDLLGKRITVAFMKATRPLFEALSNVDAFGIGEVFKLELVKLDLAIGITQATVEKGAVDILGAWKDLVLGVKKEAADVVEIVADPWRHLDQMVAASRRGIAELGRRRNRNLPQSGAGGPADYNAMQLERGAALINAGPQIDPALQFERLQRARAVGMKQYTAEAAQAWENLQAEMQRNQQMLDSMQSGFENFFESLIDGTAKASDAFKALARDILLAVSRALIIQPIASAITGGIGSYFNIPVPGRASGGPVAGGSPYVVGERGPELFIPQGGGHIVPNHQMGGVVLNQSVEFKLFDGTEFETRMIPIASAIKEETMKGVFDALDSPGTQAI